MLNSLTRFASAEIEDLIRSLQDQEESYSAELRSRDREKVVFPVKLTTLDKEFAIHAFCRDASPSGLGLITPQPFSAGDAMDVHLYLRSANQTVRAQCCWSSKFGESFWASGWQLNADVTLDIQAIKETDATVVYDARSLDRKKFAMPVVIRQKGKHPRVHGFTRNISGEGVNIVSSQPIKKNSFCLLEFVRDSGQRCEAVAECVWTMRYGDSHWMSGWQFPRLERIAKFHAAGFGR